MSSERRRPGWREAAAGIAAALLVAGGLLLAILIRTGSGHHGSTIARTPTTPAPKPPPHGRVIWRGDFETADLSQWSGRSGLGGLQAKDSSRARIVRSPVRGGDFALELTVEPGDDEVSGSHDWERAELLLPESESGGSAGDERWYAFSIWYSPSTRHTAGGIQFHPAGDGGPGQTGVRTLWPRLKLDVYAECCSPAGDTAWYSAPIALLQTARWYDVLFHVRWSGDPSRGFYESFVAGRRTSPLTYGPTLFRADRAVYLKIGIYRAPQPFPETVVIDDATAATGYGAAVSSFPAFEWPRELPG
jgi:Polysaccharide lyase